MEVRNGIIVPLGYGKYFLSDKIVGLVPIEDDRGPARRTLVHIEGLADPVVASRTEATILRDMVREGPGEVEGAVAVELLENILSHLKGIGPMLRHSIRDEAGLDLDSIEKRIIELFSGREAEPPQEGLFSTEEEEE